MAQGIARSAGLFSLPKVVSVPFSKLYFYATNTSTPVAVYTNLGLSVAHTQPIQADSEGRFAPIYIDGSLGDLRVGHYTSADALIYQIDNYPASLGTTSSVDINDQNSPLIQLIQNGATANNKVWYIHVGSEQFKLSAVNDAFSSVNDFMTVSRNSSVVTQVNFTTNLLSNKNDPVRTGDTAVAAQSGTINSTTTLTNTGLSVDLIEQSEYLIECGLYFYATTTAAMGIKLDLNATTVGRAGPMVQYVNGTGAVTGIAGFPTTPITFATLSTNSLDPDSVLFSAYTSTTTAKTVHLRWAQASSSGNNLNLLNGSWIRATRLA